MRILLTYYIVYGETVAGDNGYFFCRVNNPVDGFDIGAKPEKPDSQTTEDMLNHEARLSFTNINTNQDERI